MSETYIKLVETTVTLQKKTNHTEQDFFPYRCITRDTNRSKENSIHANVSPMIQIPLSLPTKTKPLGKSNKATKKNNLDFSGIFGFQKWGHRFMVSN